MIVGNYIVLSHRIKNNLIIILELKKKAIINLLVLKLYNLYNFDREIYNKKYYIFAYNKYKDFTL